VRKERKKRNGYEKGGDVRNEEKACTKSVRISVYEEEGDWR
jgi:hypothetical protein